MIVKLTKPQFKYLNDNFNNEEQRSLLLKSRSEERGIYIFLEVDRVAADEIRDWAETELQKRGFDINYELTQEGEILENFVDLFFADK